MHRFILLIFVTTAWSSTPIRIDSQKGAYQDGKIIRIPMNETETTDMLEKWLSQAVSSLMAAVVSRRIDQIPSDDRDDLQNCSRGANSVPEHARCVVKVLDTTTHVVKDTPISHLKKKPHKRVKIEFKKDIEWTGSFGQERMKREAERRIISRDRYLMKGEQDETLMAQVARQLTKSVRKMKNKDEVKEKWRDTVIRVKTLAEKVKEEKKAREDMKKRLKVMIENSPPEYLDPRKPIAMKQIDMEDEMTALRRMEAAKKKDEIRVPMKLMRDAIKIAMQVTGRNLTGFDKKTLKLFSPRLLSIMPDQEAGSLWNLMSPSLFSLHEDGEEDEKMFSLPKMLKEVNLKRKDQEAWLDFVVEASGVTDAVDKTEAEYKKQKEREMRGSGGVPLYFTKENATEIVGDVERRKIEVFEKLDKTYTKEQREELNKHGYAILTLDQMEILYGRRSPYAKPSVLRRFRKMRNMEEVHKHIETDIRTLAEAEKFKLRLRDIVLSPFLLTPLIGASAALTNTFVVLSPLVLSPIILSPAAIGPIILSPWVFTPLILSPRIVSPLILSPLVFSPIILSPLVLHPLILVPGVFNPLILSPLVLSPLILSPQVFTPLILSPLVLSPLLGNPSVGSPLVLSPFVLSPLILSPQFLFAVVLSPYALSPLIESKLIASEVVLSPSWLS